MLLNNEWADNKIKEEAENYVETNEDEHTTQNLWDTVKAALGVKFIAIQAHLKKIENSQINIFVNVSSMVLALITQFGLSDVKVAIDSECNCVLIRLYLQKQANGS